MHELLGIFNLSTNRQKVYKLLNTNYFENVLK